MAENSKIEWCDHTFNPWEGCQKVGPGCDNCYAEARDQRFTGGTHWGPGAPRRRTSPANWAKPIKWNRDAAATGTRPRVFCASLADVFDNAVDPQWRADLFELILKTPNLDWLLLTKRPGNIANMLPVPCDFDKHYPNVWLGCTVVNQAEADRDIPKLLSCPAAVRFLSAEPLLGPVDLTRIRSPESWGPNPEGWTFSAIQSGDAYTLFGDGPSLPSDGPYRDNAIDWVICGGESGPNARPMHPDWARSLRDQCVAAGVAFLFKQWGEWGSTYDRDRDDPDWRNVPKPGDWDHKRWLNLAGGQGFHGDKLNMMRRIGKRAAGRLLDGREWNEFPEVTI